MHWKVAAVNVFQANKVRILAAMQKTWELHKLLQIIERDNCSTYCWHFFKVVIIRCGSLGKLCSLCALCLLPATPSATVGRIYTAVAAITFTYFNICFCFFIPEVKEQMTITHYKSRFTKLQKTNARTIQTDRDQRNSGPSVHQYQQRHKCCVLFLVLQALVHSWFKIFIDEMCPILQNPVKEMVFPCPTESDRIHNM